MSKNTTLTVCSALLLAMPFTAAVAGDFGDILGFKETFVGDGRNANLEITVKGKTNKAGELYLPILAKEAGFVESSSGLLSNKPDKPKGGEKALVYRFDKGDADVTMTFAGTVDGFFKGKPKSGETSFPGQIETLSYAFTNSGPSPLANYEFRAVLPAGVQLADIPKDAKMVEEGSGHQFVLTKARVLALDKVAVKFNTYRKPGVFNMVMWGIILGVSAFWLWVRRDTLVRLTRPGERRTVEGPGPA
ncbi:hypothetical protein [Shumkonia mesophila]|uniref:hypothetical protein n=1 Tax=Shumkonia mesophila TaxID=2838854 RepID=UPI002934F182|nr:hypothetical protein [Shumkonia mesophila]